MLARRVRFERLTNSLATGPIHLWFLGQDPSVGTALRDPRRPIRANNFDFQRLLQPVAARQAPRHPFKQHRSAKQVPLEDKAYLCILMADYDSATPLYEFLRQSLTQRLRKP
jgi:hypothetical protein